MSSVGFPIFVVTTLLAGTAAAIILTPKDILRSDVVQAPQRPAIVETATRPEARPARADTAVPALQMAYLTVEVTPLSEPLPTQREPEAIRDIRRITAGMLNMRSEPNKYAELIASLPRGTEVAVEDTSGSWAYVVTDDGTEGWLSQNFLSRVE